MSVKFGLIVPYSTERLCNSLFTLINHLKLHVVILNEKNLMEFYYFEVNFNLIKRAPSGFNINQYFWLGILKKNQWSLGFGWFGLWEIKGVREIYWSSDPAISCDKHVAAHIPFVINRNQLTFYMSSPSWVLISNWSLQCVWQQFDTIMRTNNGVRCNFYFVQFNRNHSIFRLNCSSW